MYQKNANPDNRLMPQVRRMILIPSSSQMKPRAGLTNGKVGRENTDPEKRQTSLIPSLPVFLESTPLPADNLADRLDEECEDIADRLDHEALSAEPQSEPAQKNSTERSPAPFYIDFPT
ncbi:hypothetical protein N7478_013103 [Penicillium angulare]|uniref:uncharacterized protein n=1 Tax=Penicillium angulare TaxID=116970 RepID=UPI0025402568|nr:uncharacterized protein N7478_013103 [Penicillium angulare]KAJ5256999.1 hypothetical protein N7478_013103 [Penicillium angulare]